jgi:hypothetical protein
VFIGFGEVAGYFTRLADGLVALGCDVTVVLSSNPFAYEGSGSAFRAPPRPIASLVRRGASDSSMVSRVIGAFARVLLLGWAAVRQDVFVFASGGSFLRNLDLPVLRLLRKQIIVVYLGSDARPPYLSGLSWIGDDRPTLDEVHERTTHVAKSVRRAERWATAVVGHPTFGHFLRRPYYAFLAIGFPTPELPPRPAESATGPARPVRVLHAPSRPIHKGTAEITAAIELVQREGVDLQFTRLTGMANGEVLLALLTSDLVVDELYGDTFLGGLGVEAAAAGCAVLVAGYAKEVLLRSHTCPLPPVELVDPERLVDVLRSKLADPLALRTSGDALRRFVTDSWTPAAVAGRFVAVAEGTADPSWLIDPSTTLYCEGWGVSREVLRAGLRDYLGRFGTKGLMLSHRPALAKVIADFAVDGQQ